MAGLAHRPGDVGGVNRDRQPDDVDPRRHDLAHSRVAQVVESRQDVLFLQIGDSPRLSGARRGSAP